MENPLDLSSRDNRRIPLLAALALLFAAIHPSNAADYPVPEPGNYIIKDFHFHPGEVLPALRIHYRALDNRNPLPTIPFIMTHKQLPPANP